MSKIKQIDEKAQIVEVFHEINLAIECFARLSPNIPKVSLVVVQNIYGRYDDALYYIYRAANKTDPKEKEEALTLAKDALFYQFTSLNTLVSNKSITVGQANEVIRSLSKAHKDTSKWLNSVIYNNKRT